MLFWNEAAKQRLSRVLSEPTVYDFILVFITSETHSNNVPTYINKKVISFAGY